MSRVTRTIHPRALADLGEESSIAAIGVASDLRSGVIPATDFNMFSLDCCIAGHIGRRAEYPPLLASDLFSSRHPSNRALAADAIERYVYDGSEMPWNPGR